MIKPKNGFPGQVYRLFGARKMFFDAFSSLYKKIPIFLCPLPINLYFCKVRHKEINN